MSEETLEREEREERAGSLKPVIDVIPAAAYENPTWRGMLYFTRDLVIYLGSVVALVVVANPFIDVALDVLAILGVTALFVVAHDTAHGALFNSRRKNSLVGHIAMLPSWHVFEAWVLGHNRVHHAFTVRQGYDFVWHPVSAQEYADLSRAGKLLHRVEWSWWGTGLYYLKEVWWHKMMVFSPPARWARAIRRDRLITLGFVGVMAAALSAIAVARTHSLGGAAWLVLRAEVVPFLGFSAMIGSVVHVHHVAPDIRWWKRNEWSKFKGQMEGTTILRVPRGVNFFFHWIMVHSPHHVDMRIPMYNLELAAEAIERNFPDVVHDAPLRFKDFRHNTKVCKLYDFDAGRWLTYAEARDSLSVR
ncbi:MAG: fatty acid desaturase [Acidobacteriota bacterium]|nr:fatty acid desaturase [Acidobacteriota bacterium]